MSALCQLAGDYTGTIPTGGIMAEVKWDGWRALRFCGLDGKPRLWSRNGQPLNGADHIVHQLDLMERVAGVPLFLDGEVVVDDTLDATKRWFESGWRRGGDKGRLHLFDVLTEEEWRAGGSDRPLHERKAWLQELAGAVRDDPALSWDWRPGSRGGDDPTAVQVVEDEWAFTESDVEDMVQRVWAVGGEGLMLKDPEAPYRRKRGPAWLKVKLDNWKRWARTPIAA
jgi:ATP-dependent DNA ligase